MILHGIARPGRSWRGVGMALTLAAGLLGIHGAEPAHAATPELVGTFEKWKAYVLEDSAGKHCFVYSEPTEEKGDYTRRGKVSVSISHRPASKVRDEISFNAGYTLKPGSDVELKVDGKEKFTLFVDGESAWAPDSDADKKIRKALERGSKMTVQGRSDRGTLTTDVYSLKGTTAALKKIDKECGG